MKRRVITSVFLLSVCVFGCAEPLEFADWTIPVPEGIDVIEYAAVPIEERTERIEMVEDLVIGGHPDDLDYTFYRPSDIEVSSDGRIFVHDTGNHRIQAYDSTGRYLRTFSREGQGPGEINRGGQLTISGQHLVRSGDSRLSVWSLEGELIRDLQTVEPVQRPFGLSDGSLVGSYLDFNDDRTTQTKVVRLSSQGEELRMFADLRTTAGTVTLVSDAGMTIVARPGTSPTFAVSASGDVYLTPSGEYQVLSVSPDGSPHWALRVAWERMPLTDEDKRAAVLRSVSNVDVNALDIEWPSHHVALARDSLHVDGHGHLYVFPFVRDEEATIRPVDVYDAHGERLFSGLIGVPGWSDAAGDFIYRLEEDTATEERIVVRYRLVEPF